MKMPIEKTRKPRRAAVAACVVGLACATGAGAVDLSAIPPQLNSSVQPNFVVTLDDSGSMAGTALGDFPPNTRNADGTAATINGVTVGWDGGPWRCANVADPQAAAGSPRAMTMNGVYFNPNVEYTPPMTEDGNTSFPAADGTLQSVPVDGFAVAVGYNLKAVAGTAAKYYDNPDINGTATNRETTNLAGTGAFAWRCGSSESSNGHTQLRNSLYGYGGLQKNWSDPNPPGGPYYYRLKSGVALDAPAGKLDAASLTALYTAANWEQVKIASTDVVVINGKSINQWQNFANWYAYYRARSLMARTSLTLAFARIGSPTSAPVRVAWQNLGNNTTNFNAPYGLLKLGSTVIASLDDTTAYTQSDGSASHFRAAFYNWIYNSGAAYGTPTRQAVAQAGAFFGSANKAQNTTNPYWQASIAGGGRELACRQNYSLLITDGYWNADGTAQQAAGFSPSANTATTLPDGRTYAVSASGANPTTIYNGVAQDASAGTDNATMSNIAFSFWATNLRPDLPDAAPASVLAGSGPVAPYFGDLATGVTGAATTPSASNPGATDEVYWNPANDPATWPHMSSSFITLGAGGLLASQPNDLDCTVADANGAIGQNDACRLRKGQVNSAGITGWPTPNGTGNGIAANVDDLWHAALNSRGSFFVADKPDSLAAQLQGILNNVVGKGAQSTASSPTMGILTANSQGFIPGYNSTTWTGTLYKVALDAATGATKPLSGAAWEAGCVLDGGTLDTSGTTPQCTGIGNDSATRAGNRIIVSGKAPLRGIPPKSCTLSGIPILGGLLCSLVDGLTSTLAQVLGAVKYEALNQASSATAACQSGLLAPLVNGVLTTLLGQSAASAGCDGFANARIDYLRGDHGQEGTSSQAKFRARASMLGGIINSSPVYVSSATSGWVDAFAAGSAEAAAAQAGNTYQKFVTAQHARAATVYVGADDGMLHAFDAVSGKERFAYLPAAQYNRVINASGNLVKNSAVAGITNGVTPPPGVDDTPVVTDVFLNGQWRTVLVGGLRLGGRGLFALDVTDPASITSEGILKSKVLWDVDNTTTAGSGASATTPFKNLGYTYASQNIVRIKCDGTTSAMCSGSGGSWAVLVASGYFPNASSGDPAGAEPAASQTSLFVIDLATGNLIREIPTASNNQNARVTSYGLSTPAAYDIGNDQTTDVAVAGDLAGNIWRFDISDANPANWSVDLMFQTYDPSSAASVGTQPVSTEPIALHDGMGATPVWIFGTGKYLGKCDTTTSTLSSGQSDCGPDSSAAIQSLYGIFDYGTKSANYPLNKNGPNAGGSVLVQQKMTEAANVRSVTSNAVSASANGGWQVKLDTGGINAGERVVTTISPLFDSNSFIASTLIPGGDPCRPGLSGALLMLNGATGGAPAQDLVASFGGSDTGTARVVGGTRRNDNAIPTKSDGLSVLVPPGGGQFRVPFGSGVFSIDGAQVPHRGAWRQLLDML